MSDLELVGERVQLRPITAGDAPRLVAIRQTPDVRRWWGDVEPGWPGASDDVDRRAIWRGGMVVGLVQWYENADPQYRHAGIDLFLDTSAQGQGLGRETVAVVVQHLLQRGHHRIVIDPAADNARAIACYLSCGFEPVGVMRQYERDVDGAGWHDGLLMELVVDRRPPPEVP